MKEENKETPLQLTVERLGKELAQAVEDAIAAGAEMRGPIAGIVIVDGVSFGTRVLTNDPVILLNVPSDTLYKINRKAEIDKKRQELEELENELKELEK